jgi:hypothetical protein
VEDAFRSTLALPAAFAQNYLPVGPHSARGGGNGVGPVEDALKQLKWIIGLMASLLQLLWLFVILATRLSIGRPFPFRKVLYFCIWHIRMINHGKLEKDLEALRQSLAKKPAVYTPDYPLSISEERAVL